ncbi:pyridoxamine 5'-phosphate oxidase family protein [Breznakiella homolactica]|uniref:Pyridoxamine 5'-phosphate oxidase family protein n=1 Tax=Breznakiella homolactica TaxID=2798577 RepID=A0A7T8BBG5_9SPIR|nr:pyridoxamine 5'-phosphate oxidase family protein [Breznakiella homolactica]QQO10547.1 pyridoxamine 5'-phosphate oxidase family protein [Breznakiella homolactica]
MKQLDFKEKYREVMENLEKEPFIVLATLDGDKAAARTVFFFMYNSSIYFITSKPYSKYKQIAKNPNVALCINNIQIQGTAHIQGHPSLKENKLVLDFLLQKPDNAVNRYVKYKSSVLIEVKIDKIQTWTKGGREYIDIHKKEAYR